jgi:hypothetical protein
LYFVAHGVADPEVSNYHKKSCGAFEASVYCSDFCYSNWIMIDRSNLRWLIKFTLATASVLLLSAVAKPRLPIKEAPAKGFSSNLDQSLPKWTDR